jgi:hypothetical protein
MMALLEHSNDPYALCRPENHGIQIIFVSLVLVSLKPWSSLSMRNLAWKMHIAGTMPTLLEHLDALDTWHG